jgi:hypothetical protein
MVICLVTFTQVCAIKQTIFLGLSTIVTEAGPRNGTVEQGSDANLFCRVKSLISPHVQWLKKLDAIDAPSDEQVRV